MTKLSRFFGLCAITLTFAAIASAQTYTTIDFPGAISTTLNGGPNAQGTSVGGYTDKSGVVHGFTLTAKGVMKSFDPPGSTLTSPDYISPQGVIVGSYLDSGNVSHGFILSGTKYTVVDASGATGTTLTGLNPSGELSGFTCSDPACGLFGAPTVNHSFVISNPNNFKFFDPPGAVSSEASTINPSGTIVGAYTDNVGVTHGYQLYQGAFSTDDFPGSTFTFDGGNNPQGQIVGAWTDTGGVTHSFLLSNGTYTSFDPPGATFSDAAGINPSGVIVGLYQDSNGVGHGYIRTPSVPNAVASTIQVPKDYPTIQLAVNAAAAGDVISVGPGQWCGARITKQLDLEGEGGATIIGCPDGTPGPVSIGGLLRIGFLVNSVASGTIIRHFTFDGRGWSYFTNPTPLAIGVIDTSTPADNVIVDHNHFLGGLLGIQAGGSGWSITYNVFDGFTLDPVTFVGGAAIALSNSVSVETNNTVAFNKITTTVPPGFFPSWVFQPNIPFAGVVAIAQDRTLLMNNTISIAQAPGATGASAGIIVTDQPFTPSGDLTSANSVIVNNDGRGSNYAVVITLDLSGGTGNTVNTTLRGNFGVNSINALTTDVRNRSVHLLVTCDGSGVCP